MSRKRIAVLGAGPKAAALAAWAHAWASTRASLAAATPAIALPEGPQVLVFDEAARGGAAWVGGIGYSDGTPLLCTPRDADVSNGAGGTVPGPRSTRVSVASQLLAHLTPFAWTRPNVPSHQAFGDYIHSVLQRASGSDVQLHFSSAVSGVALNQQGGWDVTAGGQTRSVDGVVVTGPGPHRAPIAGSGALRGLVTDARDYWSVTRPQRIAAVSAWLKAVSDGSPHVVIAGVGGAAAAIAADLCRVFAQVFAGLFPQGNDDGLNLRITFVAPRAGLFTRGESEWETQMVRDAGPWSRLSRDLRAQANDHLMSGVVFRSVLEELEQWLRLPSPLVSIGMEPGRVVWVDDGVDTSWNLPHVSGPLRVVVHRATGGLAVHGAQLFVNAIGFDPKWFLNTGFLQPDGLVEVLRALDLPDVLDAALTVQLRALAGDTGLSQQVQCLRHLHLPMFAGGSQPPGLGSLLSLGDVAERVMARYF
jgi:mycobactin lysine-N-oxygenase